VIGASSSIGEMVSRVGSLPKADHIRSGSAARAKKRLEQLGLRILCRDPNGTWEPQVATHLQETL